MTNLDAIVDGFELLGDWEQRYQFLIELGEQLPLMPEALKTDDNKLKGCMSQVWVSAYTNRGDSSLIRFHGDCDTSMIKGVLALLIQLVSGKTAREIEALDLDEVFRRLRLHEHLSPNRHVGVYAIVEQMKQQTRRLRSNGRQGA
jgi:cysteine desulfuration protein SufE